MALPSMLQEAITYFAEPKNGNEFLAGLRWTDGKVKCPYCGSDKVSHLARVNRYKCYGKHPKAQFSLKVGTIFEDSAITLDKWLCAMWLIVNCRNGISSCEMAKDLGITQKSAWFLDHRIRFALHSGSFEKLSGHVEADETFIGSKARNMHVAQRQGQGNERLGTLQVIQGEVHKHAEAYIPMAWKTIGLFITPCSEADHRRDLRQRAGASQVVGKRQVTGKNHEGETWPN